MAGGEDGISESAGTLSVFAIQPSELGEAFCHYTSDLVQNEVVAQSASQCTGALLERVGGDRGS